MSHKKLTLVLVALLVPIVNSFSQCAMCRVTVENNFSNGDVGIGAGLNFGIMYLLVMPYIVFSVIGYFWYKSSKRNARKNEHAKSGY